MKKLIFAAVIAFAATAHAYAQTGAQLHAACKNGLPVVDGVNLSGESGWATLANANLCYGFFNAFITMSNLLPDFKLCDRKNRDQIRAYVRFMDDHPELDKRSEIEGVTRALNCK